MTTENFPMDDPPAGSTSGSPEPKSKKRRRNVLRACDRCKLKKTKCNGVQPCSICANLNTPCTFETPYSRGLAPPTIPLASRRQQSPQNIIEPDFSRSQYDSRHPSPGLESEHVEGLVGQSSNIAFSHAARVQLSSVDESNGLLSGRRAPTSSHGPTNVVTRPKQDRSWLYFSEPPFPPLRLTRLSIPSLEKGLELSSWYFENASPTYRFLHRPTVERRMSLMCGEAEWLGVSSPKLKSPSEESEECVVLMVWALACQYPVAQIGKQYTAAEKAWLHQKGIDFYQAAKSTLEGLSASIDRLSVLHVRLLMCLYLLTSSRLKASWDLFAVVKNMANNLDLSKPNISSSTSDLTKELRQRAFWAIYTLDTYLSAMLGKSFTFDERDIRIEHSTQDDTASDDDRPSMMLAPMAHAKLARIVRLALRNLYLTPSVDYGGTIVDQLVDEMVRWENELPGFLRMHTGGLLPIYARQSTVIRLAQQHALILIYRQSLPLSGLAHAQATNNAEMHVHQRIYQERCLDAAFVVYETVASLLKKGHINSQYWFSAYINFCAATVMLVYVGHHSSDQRTSQTWEAALECIKMERQFTTTNKLARRYVAALEDLSIQVGKRLALSPLAGPMPPPLPPQTPHQSNILEHHAPHPEQQPQLTGAFPEEYYDLVDPIAEGAVDPGYAWEHLLTGMHENSSFFDLDSIVSGGMNFGW